MKNVLLVILFCSITSLFYAQVIDEAMLKGKVIAEDSTAIQYAHIYYEKNTSKSSISNEEGLFLLNTQGISFNDTIIVSHIGFEVKKITINDLIKFKFIIVLHQHYLPEHTVFGLQVDELVRNAISRLDEKYFSKSFNAKGFFREIMLENNKGVYVGELAFNSLIQEALNKEDKVHIISGRESIDYRKVKSELIFGVPEIIKREPTRVKQEYLSLSGMGKYNYEIIAKTNHENREAYIVRFSSEKCSDCKSMPTRIGKIIIDTENYSILEIEFEFNNNRNIEELTEKLLGMEKTAGANIKTFIKIKYTDKNGFYYPFFYDFRSDFLFVQDGEIVETIFLVKLLINDVVFSKVEKIKDNYKQGQGLRNQTKMELSNNFFGIDTYILPSEKERIAINDVLKSK